MTRLRARQLFAPLTLLAAIAAAPPAGAQTSVLGEWNSTFDFGLEAIHAVMLPTNEVLFWQTWTDSPAKWDPQTGVFTDVTSPSVNIFCAGHAWLPDGRLFVAGGHIQNYTGEPVADIYDPYTDTWANSDSDPTNDVPLMNAGRWYPAVTTLGNGDILVTSGDIADDDPAVNGGHDHLVNEIPQVYNLATNSWRSLPGAKKKTPEYPRVMLAPDGRAISLSNEGDLTEWLDTSGAGSWETLGTTIDPNLVNYGPAVMYDGGKIAYLGGGWATTDRVSMLDLNEADPQWRFGADTMQERRRQNDATILADGTVLITGGTSCRGWNEGSCNEQNGEVADGQAGAVQYTEIWDPITEQITQVADADASIYRGYHSTATLLPDGRVLITGGNHDHDGNPFTPELENRNAQIYSPAYLFQGDRPEVTGAPDSAEHGETFFVQTPDAASIERAMIVMPGATTHSQNWGQRANRLEVELVEGGVHIEMPANPNAAPPGEYMLFLIDENGVPSVAEWIRAELATGLPGDFNGDGVVDAADYTVWRDGLGTEYTTGDYDTWVANYGQTSSAAASASVPEPAGLLLLTAAAFFAPRRSR